MRTKRLRRSDTEIACHPFGGLQLMSQDPAGNGIPVDNPIRKREQDLLGRTTAAKSFVRHVLALDASEGIVVCVFGPWGSGKTSFLNLACQDFDKEDVPVIAFNPWFFSGTEQLMACFFAELTDHLQVPGRNLEKVGEVLSEYGNCLPGTAGIVLRLGGTYLAGQRGSLASQREKAVAVMESLDKPIIVLLDDVDRLSTAEIREIFKLVRLTGCFPNLVYIVACDRSRVEKALGQEGLEGRDYLEKIVQHSYNLPESPKEILQYELTAAIEHTLSEIGCTSKIDEQVWVDVYPEIILPLIRNMRDVRRFAASSRETISNLHGQVALADILALEAVRLFLPDVFKLLSLLVSSLTVASLAGTLERHAEDQIARATGAELATDEQFQALVEAAGSETAEQIVRALLRRLFPIFRLMETDRQPLGQNVGEQHLLSRQRVAHESILRLYLERVVDSELGAFQIAKDALERMTDLNAFEEFMSSIDPSQLEAVTSRIGELANEHRPRHIELGIIGILNLWPEFPRMATDYDALRGLKAAVKSILETLDGPKAIASMVRTILPRLKCLSSKWVLISAVAFQPDRSANFVSKEDSERLQAEVRNEIRSANFNDLTEERNPAILLEFAHMTQSESPLHISESPKLTYVILRDSLTESGSGTLQSRALRVERSFNWNLLTKIYGTRETVHARIESLHQQFGEMIPWFESMQISLDEARFLIETAQRGEKTNPE